MSLVKFSDPDEFIAELVRDRTWIEDNIVRVTQQIAPAGHQESHRVTVIATAIVRTPSDRRTTLQCNAVQGTYLERTTEESTIRNAANKLVRRLRAELTEMKCDIRAGVHQEPRIG